MPRVTYPTLHLNLWMIPVEYIRGVGVCREWTPYSNQPWRTDGRTTCRVSAALYVASRGKNAVNLCILYIKPSQPHNETIMIW